jgi:hypothetical protein
MLAELANSVGYVHSCANAGVLQATHCLLVKLGIGTWLIR